MKPHALSCLAGILAGAWVGLSAHAASSQTWPLTTCDASTFAAAVQLTSTTYPGPYTSHADQFNDPVAAGSVPAPITADLIDAFNAAPPAFQTILCGLNGVFVDQRACGTNTSTCSSANAWGFRDPGNQQLYIGLPMALWQGSSGQWARASNYSDRETTVLWQTITALGGKAWPADSSPPKFSSASSTPSGTVDTPGTTVLAALAHEYGHILWYLKLKGDVANTGYHPSRFCNPSFFQQSWYSDIKTPVGRWVDFGDASPDTQAGLPPTEVIKAINDGSAKFAAIYLRPIYSDDTPTYYDNSRTGVWASFLASVSAQEDFAETFKFYVLTHWTANQKHPITSMPLKIYGANGASTGPDLDVYADYAASNKKTELKRKVQCIASISPF